jgi:amphi-Trp domain-containing protein
VDPPRIGCKPPVGASLHQTLIGLPCPRHGSYALLSSTLGPLETFEVKPMAEDHETEMVLERSDFVAELRRLADALEAGTTFSLDVDGETVEIPEGAVMAVAFEREDGSVELEFQLSWSEPSDEEDEDDEDEDEDMDEEEAEKA